MLKENATRKLQNPKVVILMGVLMMAILGVDFVADPIIQVHFFLVILIGLVAWFTSPRIAYILAASLPLIRFCIHIFTPPIRTGWQNLANTTIEIGVMCVAVFMITRIKALALEVKLAKERIPICTYCRRIRNLNGEWEQIESYMSRQPYVEFTHGICSECNEEQFGTMLKRHGVKSGKTLAW